MQRAASAVYVTSYVTSAATVRCIAETSLHRFDRDPARGKLDCYSAAFTAIQSGPSASVGLTQNGDRVETAELKLRRRGGVFRCSGRPVFRDASRSRPAVPHRGRPDPLSPGPLLLANPPYKPKSERGLLTRQHAERLGEKVAGVRGIVAVFAVNQEPVRHFVLRGVTNPLAPGASYVFVGSGKTFAWVP